MRVFTPRLTETTRRANEAAFPGNLDTVARELEKQEEIFDVKGSMPRSV